MRNKDININLSYKQSLAFQYLEDTTTTELLYGGAAGGGKDFLACVWHISRRLKYPDTRGFIGRETHKALMGSTFNTFINIVNAMGLQKEKDYRFDGRTGELKWFNKSSTIFGYLERNNKDPNYNRLGSTEFTDVVVNEAVECNERAVDILKSRIRYNLSITEGKCPKLLLLSNPDDCWLKYRFISTVDNKEVILKPYQKYIQAKLFDNPDKEFQRNYLRSLQEMSEYDQRRLINGDWEAKPKLGGEFFDKLDYQKHGGECTYNQELPLWVSIDNNVLPYIAVTIWQSDKENKRLFQIGEICAVESTATNAGLLCAQYINNNFNHQGDIYVTGDPSTKNRNTISPDKETFIELFSQALRDNGFITIDRMLIGAPSVYTSGDFVNQILNNYEDWVIIIDNNHCIRSINDYLSVKKDSDGSMRKEKEKNIYGSTYEKNGHLSDTFRYFIIACLNNEYETWRNRNSVFNTMYRDFNIPTWSDLSDL